MSDFTVGSGNVFADLGLPDADLRLAKADLALGISRRIRELGLTQTAAAQRMGLDQPKVSALVRGRLSGFSLDRLTECLSALDCQVIIHYHPVAQKAGGVIVMGRPRYKMRLHRRRRVRKELVTAGW